MGDKLDQRFVVAASPTQDGILTKEDYNKLFSGGTEGQFLKWVSGEPSWESIQESPIKAWVRFDASANIISSFNVSAVNIVSGEFEITFSTPMTNANYGITGTAIAGSSINETVLCKGITPSTSTEAYVRMFDVNSDGGGNTAAREATVMILA